MVTTIAATLQDVEVIEWSFTCLAFLFKYLSKLLVPDLRPTYDLMAPLLGKHRQQPHIARFAAEAMSFLIKKAGAPAHREKALPLIIKYAKEDLRSITETRQFNLYYHGLMTLFAEAMKGNGPSVHSSGPAVFQALFESIDEEDLGFKEISPWMNVICGVLTSIVHHTSSDTFKDVLDVVLYSANAALKTWSEQPNVKQLRRLLLSTRMIGVVAGVRKGSRIKDWPAVLKTMSDVLRSISKNAQIVIEEDQNTELWSGLVLSISIVFQYAPMDAIISFIATFMDSISKDPLANWFLTFCSYFSEADPERFRSIALPYFQRYVA
jgi:U3 small nucleolar RNA-associated protein 20